ncbi:ABC transporter ATP-binding protein [Mameliella alba]|nr:ABC transporter ATP-binding protein [Mameliella alba]
MNLPIQSSADEATNPVLQVRGVTKRFGAYVAVHDMDLDIKAGEFVTLLGPSGCGKTTLLRMIAGLEEPSSGTMHSQGRDVTRLRPEHRPFNMVFQSYALFPHLTVFENVAYGLRARGVEESAIKTKVSTALELVGLGAYHHHAVDELSGGMRQRVALVRAVVNEPQILLLDEPLAALDLQLRRKMQIELRSIQQELGTTFILVTHDQEEALVMSDRIIVMQGGRVEQIGTPRDIYQKPQTKFVAEFIGETALVDCRIADIGSNTVQVTFENGIAASFDYYCPRDFSVGDRGAVSFRPEQLRIVNPEGGLFQGTITDQIFLGAVTKLQVSLDSGSSLGVALSGGTSVALGQRLGVAVAPGEGVFLHNGTGETK